MKKCLVFIIIVSFVFIGTAFAEKPDWVSKKKAVKEDMNAQKKEMKAYGDKHEKKEKKAKKIKGEKMKGLEKQRDKKSTQVQKELDKGSEKGQDARQQRKKWWKPWGETE